MDEMENMNKKNNMWKAVVAFVVALTVILSGAAMGVNSGFSEKEQISSSDVDNTIIIDSDSMDLQTLGEDPPMPLGFVTVELLYEDFSGSFLPAGWTQEEPGEWYKSFTEMTSSYSGEPEAAADYATIMGDYAYLRTVPVDSSSLSSLSLECVGVILDYAYASSYSCYVKTRADAGDAWTDRTPWSNPIYSDVGVMWADVLVDISSDIGTGTEVMFEFVGVAYDLDFWVLDDVEIYGEQPTTPVSIDPPTQIVEKGEAFTVSVYVEPCELIRGINVDYLYFDETLINTNPYSVDSVTFEGFFDPYETVDSGVFGGPFVDNDRGEIRNIFEGIAEPGNVSTPGYFCNISFIALQNLGTSYLNLDGVIINDDAGGEGPFEVNNGSVTVIEPDTAPPEITDVTLTASDPLDTGSGWEEFSCTITDNIGVDEVKLVLVGDTPTEYPMMKDGDDYYCNMTITTADKYIYHVWANDTNGNGNTSTPQPFDLPLNEDVTMADGKVHFMDIMRVAGRYNDVGPDGWIREDVDNGGKVHFMDIMAIAGHYNEEW